MLQLLVVVPDARPVRGGKTPPDHVGWQSSAIEDANSFRASSSGCLPGGRPQPARGQEVGFIVEASPSCQSGSRF